MRLVSPFSTLQPSWGLEIEGLCRLLRCVGSGVSAELLKKLNMKAKWKREKGEHQSIIKLEEDIEAITPAS